MSKKYKEHNQKVREHLDKSKNQEELDTLDENKWLIKKEHRDRIDAAINELNDILDEVGEYLPRANWYLADSTFHLMSGDSHDNRTKGGSLQANVAHTARRNLAYSGGGGW